MISNKKSSNSALLLLLLLVLPVQSFHLYFVLSFLLIALFTINVKMCWSTQAKYIALFIVYYFITSSFRFFSTLEPNIRDFFDIVRFIPLLYLMLKKNYFKDLSYDSIVKACFIYLIIDGTVTFLQFFGSDYLNIVNIVNSLYTSDGFFESLDMIRDRRSPGICAQIGQHGAIMMSITVIMLSAIMNKCNLKLMSTVGFVLSLSIIVVNQSRTSFIAVVVAISLLAIYYLLFGRYDKKLVIVLIASIVGLVGVLIFINYEDMPFKVGYLYKLSNRNNTLGSLGVRLNKWDQYPNMVEERIWWAGVGWGKDYFGNLSASFDNDFVHIFFVYGPVILILLIVSLIYYIFKTLRSSKKFVSRNFEMSFFFVLMGGIVVAFGASFVMYPQIIYILFFLYCGSYWENMAILAPSKGK